MRAALDGGDLRAATGGRAQRPEGRRRDRFPGDLRRARKNAAPQAARCAPRDLGARPRGGAARSRHHPHRRARGQPLPLSRDGRPGCPLRRGGRKHRYRRPGDAARGGEKPRPRLCRVRPRRLSARASGAAFGGGAGLRLELAHKAFAHTAAYDAAIERYLAAQLTPPTPSPKATRPKRTPRCRRP